MKYLWSIIVLVTPCVGHPHRHPSAFLEQKAEAGLESGAARIIHSIRGAERALAKDLRGEPKLLLSEERLLHQASQLALKAGKRRAMQMHAAKKLHGIEASLIQHKQSAFASSGAQFASLAKQEARLLHDGHGILQEVRVLKGDLTEALGQSDPEVTAKLEHLMDRVGGAQKEILRSESEAASHASKLAASVRKEAKAPTVTGLFQAHATQRTGTKDPVRRMQLSKEALRNLVAAKGEVEAAYGTEDGTAQKLEALMGQLSGSLTGLEEGSEEDAKVDMKSEEAEEFASIEAKAGLPELKADAEKAQADAANAETQAMAQQTLDAKADAAKAKQIQEAVAQAKAAVKVKASLVQATARSTASKRAMSRRFHQQGLRMRRLAQRTRRLAKADGHIAKETFAVRRYVDKELGDTKVGEEVDSLLKEAAKDANRAAAGEHHVAAIENKQVESLTDMAAGFLTAELMH